MNFLCLDIQILFISTEKSCSKLLTMHSRTFAIRPNLHQPHVLLFFSPLSVSHHSVHQPCWTFPKHTLPSCVLGFLNSLFLLLECFSFSFLPSNKFSFILQNQTSIHSFIEHERCLIMVNWIICTPTYMWHINYRTNEKIAIVINAPADEIQDAGRVCNERTCPAQGGLPWGSNTLSEHWVMIGIKREEGRKAP